MLVLGFNNCATNDPCSLCGRRTDPAGGYEVMDTVEGGLALVCDECQQREEPVLFAARMLINETEGFTVRRCRR